MGVLVVEVVVMVVVVAVVGRWMDLELRLIGLRTAR